MEIRPSITNSMQLQTPPKPTQVQCSRLLRQAVKRRSKNEMPWLDIHATKKLLGLYMWGLSYVAAPDNEVDAGGLDACKGTVNFIWSYEHVVHRHSQFRYYSLSLVLCFIVHSVFSTIGFDNADWNAKAMLPSAMSNFHHTDGAASTVKWPWQASRAKYL